MCIYLTYLLFFSLYLSRLLHQEQLQYTQRSTQIRYDVYITQLYVVDISYHASILYVYMCI